MIIFFLSSLSLFATRLSHDIVFSVLLSTFFVSRLGRGLKGEFYGVGGMSEIHGPIYAAGHGGGCNGV